VHDKEPALPSVLRDETEQDREVTKQLKQANDTIARLQDELSDFRRREKAMKERDSKISIIVTICLLHDVKLRS